MQIQQEEKAKRLEKSIAWRKEMEEKREQGIKLRKAEIEKDAKRREEEIKKKEKMRKALIKMEHEKRDEAKKRYQTALELRAKEERE